MTITFPTPDPEILSRRSEIIRALSLLLPANSIVTTSEELSAFETDALTAYRHKPLIVVLPSSTEEVAAVMRYCAEGRIPVVPRGAGTSLSGGAIPQEDAVVLGLSKMNRILKIDPDSRCATVQAGVTNLAISGAVAHEGLFYAPDPSSQLACTIGGNVAMNSGGAHCLKYGVTTNNLLGVVIVLLDGSVIHVGGEFLDAPGYDFLGLICGSEGQLGIVTEATVRLLPIPEGARPMLIGFASPELAGACVAAILSAGIIPVAIEYMDRLAIEICEGFAKAGYPLDVEAMLIIEVEGSPQEIDETLDGILRIAGKVGLLTSRIARNAEESQAIWKGRKAAFGATGRISDYICMDGTIPTGRLPEVLSRIQDIVAAKGLRVANVFHAGDGNLHPLVLFDINRPGELEKAEEVGADILRLCVEVGGCLTGEHGVGIEKRDLMPLQFTGEELGQQMRVRAVFDPDWLMNPAKVFPLEGRPMA